MFFQSKPLTSNIPLTDLRIATDLALADISGASSKTYRHFY